MRALGERAVAVCLDVADGHMMSMWREVVFVIALVDFMTTMSGFCPIEASRGSSFARFSVFRIALLAQLFHDMRGAVAARDSLHAYFRYSSHLRQLKSGSNTASRA